MAFSDAWVTSGSAIIIALIGGYFGIRASRVAHKNEKRTQNITDVLANTKSPVDSLDQVIKIMQDEFAEASTRHATEIKYQQTQLDELKEMLGHCQHERSNLSVELEKMKTLIKKHELQLNGPVK